MKDKMLTLNEVADILGQAYPTAYSHARRGELGYVFKLGNNYRVPKSQLFKKLELVGNFDNHVEDRMLNIYQFAELARLKEQTIYKHIKAGNIPDFHKLGGTWYISFSNASKMLGLNYIFDEEKTEKEKMLDDVLDEARRILRGETNE